MARGSNLTNQRPIIVKKIVSAPPVVHHSGAWKVAYADFVTAMMAFFLLMWLISSTDEAGRKALAEYFTPTLVEMKKNNNGAANFLAVIQFFPTRITVTAPDRSRIAQSPFPKIAAPPVKWVPDR